MTSAGDPLALLPWMDDVGGGGAPAVSQRSADLWDVVGLGFGGGGLIRESARRGGNAQLLQDIQSAILGSVEYLPGDFLALIPNSREKFFAFAQTTATLFAAEVGITALAAMPEPTLTTKLTAIVLQALMIAFLAHAAHEEMSALAGDIRLFVTTIGAANGQTPLIAAASRIFAKLGIGLIKAALQAAGLLKKHVEAPNEPSPPPDTEPTLPPKEPASAGEHPSPTSTEHGPSPTKTEPPPPTSPESKPTAEKGSEPTTPPRPGEPVRGARTGVRPRATAADVPQLVERLRQSPNFRADPEAFESTIRDASQGQEGALGELDAIQRWLDEGRQVEIPAKVENATLKNGNTKTNPDYVVDGRVIELKTRSSRGGGNAGTWIKNKLKEANSQIKNISDSPPTGSAVLQFHEEGLSVAQVSEAVTENFRANQLRQLTEVTIYNNGELLGRWIRTDAGIERAFP